MDNRIAATQADNSVAEENLNLRHYWHIILERRWLVASAFISVFVLCIIYLFRATPIYQATAQLQINREGENIVGVRDTFTMDSREQDYLQTQYRKLKSRSLLEKVATDLNLNKDPRYMKSRDIVKSLAADVTISPIRLSRLVDIKVEHPKASQAAAIANKLVLIFKDNNLDEKKQASQTAITGLKVEVETQKKMAEDAELALQKYREKITNVSVEESQNIVLMALKEAQLQLTLMDTKAKIARKLDQEVQQQLKSGVPTNSIEKVVNDKLVQELRSQLATQESELNGLLKRLKNLHPDVKKQREKVESLKNSIAIAADSIINSLHSDANISEATVEILQAGAKDWEKKQLALGEQRVEYDRLNGVSQLQKKMYLDMLKAEQDLQLSTKTKINNMTIVDMAKEELGPVKPRFMLTMFLGFFGGLAVAIGLAFFVNYLDDSIKTQDDVEVYLRLPFLGYVPNIKSNSVIERDLQAHAHPQSNAAEGFRTIRAAVALMPKAEKYRVLVVTSTIPSEGKSLLASNLAIVTAQTGLKTLLVDADLRRPSVHKAFQLHSPIGLSAYLTENASSLEEIVRTTEVPNLDVVCAGAIPSNPSELSGSKRMRQFLEEVAKRYDRVFLDCPPVSAVSDPLVIAALSDGVVFVTKFNKIRREHARKSIQRLQDAGIHLLGVVLNDIDFEGRDSYYYSYYYYQNRYYASHYTSEHKVKSPTEVEKS